MEELQNDIAKFDESVRDFLASHSGNYDGKSASRRGARGRGSRGPRKAAKPRGDITARIAKVNQAFLAGEYDRALELVSEVIRINAEIHQAWTALASIFREQGHIGRALSAMVYAAHLRPKDVAGWLHCASFALDTADLDEQVHLKTARLCYSAALKAEFNNIEARLGKAAICHQQGHYAQAAVEYSIALRTRPADLEIVRKLAEAAVDSQYSQSAASAALEAYGRFFSIAQAASAGYDLTDLWYDIGTYVDIFAAMNRLKDAITHLRRLSRWISLRKEESFWDQSQGDDREWDLSDERRMMVDTFTQGRFPNSAYGLSLPLFLRMRLAIYRLRTGDTDEALVCDDKLVIALPGTNHGQ